MNTLNDLKTEFEAPSVTRGIPASLWWFSSIGFIIIGTYFDLSLVAMLGSWVTWLTMSLSAIFAVIYIVMKIFVKMSAFGMRTPFLPWLNTFIVFWAGFTTLGTLAGALAMISTLLYLNER